jgi:dTDP-glucose 4,6-dehydratase
MILKAVAGEPLPVMAMAATFATGFTSRTTAAAIVRVLEAGRVGQTYNIGGNSERRNIDLVRELCRLIDVRMPRSDASPHESQIAFVEDRPGHDRRYAIDARKIRHELGWVPSVSFEEGLARTLDWYLTNAEWVRRARTGLYRGERLGQRQ